MYLRNKQALFWALFFPLLIMIILGMMNFDKYASPNVGIYDAANNDASQALILALGGTSDEELLSVTTGTLDELHNELEFGSSRAVIEISTNYGISGEFAEIKVTYDERFQQERAVVSTILGQVTDAVFKEAAQVPDEYRVENSIGVSETLITGQGQGFKAWLIPGVAAMAIMQTGLFTVVFTLVRFKSEGVLRRLKATPIGACSLPRRATHDKGYRRRRANLRTCHSGSHRAGSKRWRWKNRCVVRPNDPCTSRRSTIHSDRSRSFRLG